MNYLLERLKEPSTWRGLIRLAIVGGVVIAPEHFEDFVALGLLIAGIIGVMTPDKGKEDA